MRMRLIVSAMLVLCMTVPAVQAQVANWNHFVQDEALEQAFHSSLNQVAMEYIRDRQGESRSAAILFKDSQRDVPLVLTSSTFRPALMMAAAAKAAYVVDYQALTSDGVRIQLNQGNTGGSGGGLLPEAPTLDSAQPPLAARSRAPAPRCCVRSIAPDSSSCSAGLRSRR